PTGIPNSIKKWEWGGNQPCRVVGEGRTLTSQRRGAKLAVPGRSSGRVRWGPRHQGIKTGKRGRMRCTGRSKLRMVVVSTITCSHRVPHDRAQDHPLGLRVPPSDGVRGGAYWAERHGAAGHWEEL